MIQPDIYNTIKNKRGFQKVSITLLLALFTASCFGQQISQSKPDVTNKLSRYKEQVKEDSSKKMIELKSLIPGLVYDLRYATTNNFTHRRMYPEGTDETFLRLPAAYALAKAEKELNEKGLGFKIFDAYRPFSVTVKFWELIHDERYVAKPSQGSGHNKGIAVDLTIINLKTGKELDMGTGFDNFTDSAHQDFTDLPKPILENRSLLKATMEKYGFKPLATEWWHYYLNDGNKYEVLDIDFKKLKKLN